MTAMIAVAALVDVAMRTVAATVAMIRMATVVAVATTAMSTAIVELIATRVLNRTALAVARNAARTIDAQPADTTTGMMPVHNRPRCTQSRHLLVSPASPVSPVNRMEVLATTDTGQGR